jgi:hypothetical protein
MGSSREMEVVGGKLSLRPSKGAGGGRLASKGGGVEPWGWSDGYDRKETKVEEECNTLGVTARNNTPKHIMSIILMCSSMCRSS